MEVKDIMTHPGVVEQLSFDEVMDRYTPLLNKRCQGWANTYEYDELWQTCSIALWRAYKDYDYTKNITFGYVAGKYVDFALMSYHNKCKPKYDRKTSLIKTVISIDMPIVADRNGEVSTVEEMLGEEDSFTDLVVNRDFCRKLLSILPARQRADVVALSMGYTLADLSKVQGITKQAIGRKVRNSYQMCREMVAHIGGNYGG